MCNAARSVKACADVGSGGSGFAVLTDFDKDNLRRYPQSNWCYRAAKPTRDDEMAITFNDMAIRVAVSETRGDNWRITEEAYLTAVRMPRQRETNTGGDSGKNVWLVSKQYHGRGVVDLSERRIQVIHSTPQLALPTRAGKQCDLIPQTSEPKWLAIFMQFRCVVLVDANSHLF